MLGANNIHTILSTSQNKCIYKILCICLLLSFFSTHSLSQTADGTSWWNTDYNSTEGQEFFVTFMVNYGKHVQDEDLSLSIYATARQRTNVKVTGTWTDPVSHESKPYEKTFVVRPNQIDSIFIPNEVAYLQESNQTSNEEWLNKGIKITSDHPIALYAHNANVNSYDASLILPTKGLYKEYIIQTYTEDMQSTEFAIVSAKNDNDITINLRETRNNATTTSEIKLTLQEGQTYCYRPTDRTISLTGTTICASQPIAVFQGGQHAKIPRNQDPASHVFHQAFSTDYWGKHYYVTRTANQSVDFVRITANENNTVIRKKGVVLATINRFETYEDVITWQTNERAIYYETSKSAEVFLYASHRNSGHGSPALTPIVPTEQGIRSVILATFHETRVNELGLPSISTAQDTINKYYHHYVNIVTPTSAVAGMRMDNVNIGSRFAVIQGTTYSCAIVDISDGTHILTNDRGDFTSRVYGFYAYDGNDYNYDMEISYAYSGGNNTLHSAYMLIDGARINSKTICVNEDINFGSVVNYDYTQPITWLFEHNSDTVADINRTGTTLNNFVFPNPGLWTVNMIVNSTTPVCQYQISDTIKARINVSDKFNYSPSCRLGTLRYICPADRSSTIIQGQTYKYRTDTMQLGRTYNFVDTLTSSVGCDSIVQIKVIVGRTHEITTSINLCQNALPFKWNNQTITADQISSFPYQTTLTANLKTKTSCGDVGCDSIVHLKVTINNINHDSIAQALCAQDTPYHWHIHGKDSLLYTTGIYYDTIKNTLGCDDIAIINLTVYPTSNVEIKENGCEPLTYNFGGEKTYYAGHAGDTIYYDTIHVVTPEGCKFDSTLMLTVYKSYSFAETLTINDQEEFIWYDGNHGTQTPGTHTFTYERKTKNGCDSIYHMTLTVQAAFSMKETAEICYGADFTWTGHLKDTTLIHPAAGSYTIVDANTTIEGQDSTYTLTLTVHPNYDETLQQATVCQDKVPYQWQLRDSKQGSFTKTINIPSAATFPFDSLCVDTLQSVFACDSIVRLPLRILPTYVQTVEVTLCESEMPYTWQLNDKSGSHNKTISLPSDHKGKGWTYTDVYSLSTNNTDGCDSVIKLQLTVLPTVTYEHDLTICNNMTPYYAFGNHDIGATKTDRYEVKINGGSRQYGCDSIEILNLTVIETIVTPIYVDRCNAETPYNHPTENIKLTGLTNSGTYRDTLHTAMGCDSIIELHLTFHPEYDKTLNIDICDNETYDFCDSLYHGSAGTYHFDTLLTSIYGCDSLVHLNLTIHPTYLFVTDTSMCIDEGYTWRGKTYTETGIYYDSLSTTQHGCDSVYMLRLYVKPQYRFKVFRTLCANDTLYHLGNKKMVVWEPSMPIPQTDQGDYIELAATTVEGCDSSYIYYLTINPVYDFIEEPDTICDNTIYQWHGGEYTFEAGMYRLDTTLQTINGCDSSFHQTLYVMPTYHFLTLDTLCFGETYLWHGQEIKDYPAGNHTFYDRHQTIHGCDSIYELHLTINPTYFTQIVDSICVDEQYNFNGRMLTKAGLYTDSLKTINGCDSVFHLYLTVNDTTSEHLTDSICEGESITIYGKTYSSSGHYLDTTLNQWGCKNYVTLDLDVIQYTIPHISADSICADNDAYELYLSFTGEQPIEFSIYYDDFGHSQGFHDVVHAVVDNVDTLVVPMPLRDGDKTKYPRPEHYPIDLYVFNPYCQDSVRQHDQTDIILSYPSWVTEQRFRDVIAILSTNYNGGYTFDTYQWYKDGEALIGETHEYLYLPQELEVETAEYYVRLTRPGETESYQTCPITIYADNIDHPAPELDYLSVVPTFVVAGHPVVNILSNGRSGQYTITTLLGSVCGQGKFTRSDNNAYEVTIDCGQGWYIFELWTDDGEYERHRIIHVLVGP